MSDIDFLKQTPLFANLDEAQLQAIAADVVPRHCRQGQVIFHETDLLTLNANDIRQDDRPRLRFAIEEVLQRLAYRFLRIALVLLKLPLDLLPR